MTSSPAAHAALERAYKDAVHLSARDQAGYVQEVLGSRLAAAALGLKDTRTLSSWSGGGPIRGVDHQHRLQVLFRVTRAIDLAFGPPVAAAFLRGSNPTLGNTSPLVVLADQDPVVAEPELMTAVEALLLS